MLSMNRQTLVIVNCLAGVLDLLLALVLVIGGLNILHSRSIALGAVTLFSVVVPIVLYWGLLGRIRSVLWARLVLYGVGSLLLVAGVIVMPISPIMIALTALLCSNTIFAWLRLHEMA